VLLIHQQQFYTAFSLKDRALNKSWKRVEENVVHPFFVVVVVVVVAVPAISLVFLLFWLLLL
jgi:hypothetical protein